MLLYLKWKSIALWKLIQRVPYLHSKNNNLLFLNFKFNYILSHMNTIFFKEALTQDFWPSIFHKSTLRGLKIRCSNRRSEGWLILRQGPFNTVFYAIFPWKEWKPNLRLSQLQIVLYTVYPWRNVVEVNLSFMILLKGSFLELSWLEFLFEFPLQ